MRQQYSAGSIPSAAALIILIRALWAPICVAEPLSGDEAQILVAANEEGAGRSAVGEMNFGSSTLYPDFDPRDLAPIEVLRGPQGTLYGTTSLTGTTKFETADARSDSSGESSDSGANRSEGGDKPEPGNHGSASIQMWLYGHIFLALDKLFSGELTLSQALAVLLACLIVVAYPMVNYILRRRKQHAHKGRKDTDLYEVEETLEEHIKRTRRKRYFRRT